MISDVFGVSGRAMLEAMIAGQRSPRTLAADAGRGRWPRTLAELAKGSMRGKIEVIVEALTGHFEDHHAFLARRMLDRVDAVAADIATVEQRIETMIAPFADQVARLDEITGVGVATARELIAEIGVDMTRFPAPAHLVSWAKFAPIDKKSAGRSKTATTGKGNPWLGGAIGESVAATTRTRTFLGERYRRITRRRGKQRAIVATGNSLLTIIWHLLSDPDTRYHDLGADLYTTRVNTHHRQRNLIRQLETMTGQKVHLTPAA